MVIAFRPLNFRNASNIAEIDAILEYRHSVAAPREGMGGLVPPLLFRPIFVNCANPLILGGLGDSDGVEYSTSEYEYCKKLRVRVQVLILKNVLEYEYRKKVRVRVLLQI